MKKLLAAILFFGSVGTAMAQWTPNSPGYYSAMTEGWNPNSPIVRAVTPTIFQAPVQAGQAIYNTYRAATNTCPSQRLLGACPNDSSKGYLYLPPGTRSCSVGADLGKYCYKGRPGQKGENSTIIGPTRFQTEGECQIAACGIAAKPLRVEVIVGDAPECPAAVSPSPAGTWYLREAPTVPVTFSISGGTPPYRVGINGTTYRTGSMVTIFMNAYSARIVSGTASDSGSPRQSIPVSASVPACKKPKNSCSGIAGLIKELEALLDQPGLSDERRGAIKLKIASLLDTCASSEGCEISGNSCVSRAPMCGNNRCAAGESCCSGVPYDEPTCATQCRRCLSSASSIATPLGNVAVTSLKVGDIVWSVDSVGNRIVRPLIAVSHVSAINHRVVRLVLADSRTLDVSGPHPTANGKLVSDLKIGDAYDGSVVKSAETKPYEGSATYDILPAGETGFYWANGILMGSTLK